ncbi:Uncharacterised protein [Streptococcus pneumoniae]|nr:Uncharacterised protein [Streptococcus pneumoniae]
MKIKDQTKYSMKIKEQTKKLEIKEQTRKLAAVLEYGKATLMWFEFYFRRVLVNLMLFFPRFNGPFMATTFKVFDSLVNREPGNMIKVF